MTNKPPVGVGERDDEYSTWLVEDFVARMLENERRKKGSIQRWVDSVLSDFYANRDRFKEELRLNRVVAEAELGRQVRILGTDEEAQGILWEVRGRLLLHLSSRRVMAPMDDEEVEHFILQGWAAA